MVAENIIELTRKYVSELLSGKLPDGIFFHNVEHTKEVVKAAIEIAQACNFSPKQLEIVTLSAWFHDCGYTVQYINHEDSSKAIASDFLTRYGYPKDDIERVLACIEATRFPQNPQSPEDNVIADADLYHFTKPDYPKYEQRLRKEFEIHLGKSCTDVEWNKTNYTFLQNHSYHTEYGQTVLQKSKEVNIERIKQILP
ncbi:HD domain-containing protein [Elizabethkingia anophelis]|uniref:HD domain-containing protein n=1 Tax=Elizabethkingia anophelis TaxID=1117645 RepID=UPI001626E7BB|nr:HD domain-containing protein [Elizabethkingia anophelis]MDV4116303.1 hypothetical protein [Elizabethkingia anophelis]